MFPPKFVPLGVVVRFQAVVAEQITLRPYGQQLLKLFCSWDRKKLNTSCRRMLGSEVTKCWQIMNLLKCMFGFGAPSREPSSMRVPACLHTPAPPSLRCEISQGPHRETPPPEVRCNKCLHIYIYIYREREIERYIYIYMYTHTHIERERD